MKFNKIQQQGRWGGGGGGDGDSDPELYVLLNLSFAALKQVHKCTFEARILRW